MSDPYTFTLVIKVDMPSTDGIGQEVTKILTARLADLGAPLTVVLGRWSPHSKEAIVLVHTWNDCAHAIGGRLASWLSELPYVAPFPSGSLLWYR